MGFLVKIQPEVRSDIQTGVDWYNEQESGLASQFFTSVEAHIRKLQSNPFYQVRYDTVRCLPIKRFPYIIHFTIDESHKIVNIMVFLTHIEIQKFGKRELKNDPVPL